MSDNNDGGPAFPYNSMEFDGDETRVSTEPGMTLRDWFAGQALAGMASSSDMWVAIAQTAKLRAITESLCIARSAYDIADAMLAARKAVKP